MKRAGLIALLSHWRRNPLQLFTLVAGLALATALWSGVQAVNSEARASYATAANTLGSAQFDVLMPRDGGSISHDTYIALRRAGWLVSPIVEGAFGGLRLVGVEPLTAPRGLSPIDINSMNMPEMLTGRGQVFVAPSDVTRLVDLGINAVALEGLTAGMALTDIGVAQTLLGVEDEISRLVLLPDQIAQKPPLADIAPNLTKRVHSGDTDIAQLTDSFHLNLTAFGFLAFAVGIFIVNGAIGLAFEQRRPVIRTLRALGMPLRQLIGLMAFELAMIALLAGGIGIVLGYVLAASLMPDVAATLRGLYGAEIGGTLSLRPSWWLSGLAIALGGTAIAAAGAFWSLAQMPLLAAAQKRAQSVGSARTRRLMGGIALLLILSALALTAFGTGLFAGFALLAALLIGAALALPLLLDLVLTLGQSMAKNPVAQWFWADTRQQLPGLSLALMALLLAMAANVGVSTMVSSFRLTFAGFLDQRMSSELYVTVETDAQSATLEPFLMGRADAVLPIISVTETLFDSQVDLYGARDHQTYPDNWTFLSAISDPWPALHDGTGILVNEQMARRIGLSIGDVVQVQNRDFNIVGIHGDYGNPIGQAILGAETFAALYPDAVAHRFGVRVAPENARALQVALIEEFGLPAANVIDQASIKAVSMEIFERTFTVTGALNVLTLAVAGFAILMSLLTLAALRVPQLAPVWALGLTRRALGRYEMYRAVLLATLTGLFALPLGLALSWVLLAVVNVEAFGWRLPMYLFPADYARLGLFALLAAIIAALWPAIRLARTPPSALLQVFAHER